MSLGKNLENFKLVLEQEKNFFGKESKRNVEYAVALIKRALEGLKEESNKENVTHSLEQLAYMVSDSLPWNDRILSSWEKVEKALRKIQTQEDGTSSKT